MHNLHNHLGFKGNRTTRNAHSVFQTLESISDSTKFELAVKPQKHSAGKRRSPITKVFLESPKSDAKGPAALNPEDDSLHADQLPTDILLSL